MVSMRLQTSVLLVMLLLAEQTGSFYRVTVNGQVRSYPAPRGEAGRPHELVVVNGQIWYCYQTANALGR